MIETVKTLSALFLLHYRNECNLLQAQQELIRQSEERDKEAIQAMMKFEADSEQDTKN